MIILLATWIMVTGVPAQDMVTAGVDTEAGMDTIPRHYIMPQIMILEARNGLFGRTPGSVTLINTAQIRRLAPLSGNDVLRTVPGLHITDEEGAGLRINLGIRGMDPDRSRGVLVLEDGLPVALAPYGEPEMYYTPAIERMSGVEVLKGSGQIMFGPQTIGGIVNYITADPPADPEGYLRLQAGQGGLLTTQVGHGATHRQAGYQVHYMHKRADRLAYAGFRVQDLTGKFRFELGPRAHLGLKLAFYDEWSDATYIGLTQTMYERGGEDFVAMAPHDQLNIRRYSGSLTHLWRPHDRGEWRTALFGYSTTRNWQRQDFSSNALSANQTGVIWGEPSVPGGAIYMLNSVSHRNRQFEVSGIDTRYQHRHKWGGMAQQWDMGLRLLYERALEQRINGGRADANSGNLVEDEQRTGRALSAHIQHRWEIYPGWELTSGLRSETFFYEREIYRNLYNGVITDTLVRAENNTHTWIPGIGIHYQMAPHWMLFAGLHRGFAPPRVKDAITRAGEALDLEAEYSWNSELGVRRALHRNWALEGTAFLMDFSNQIIPVSESSGGQGSGFVNGGATRHYGVELGLDLRLGEWLGHGHQLDLYSATTLLRAYYQADRFIQSQQIPVNIRGNRTPYSPEFQQSTTLTYTCHGTWGVSAHATMTSDQFTDELNTRTASANGRSGRIAGYRIYDAHLFYQWTSLRLGVVVKNLTDERYIMTRRPQGIRLGLPRHLSFTASFRF